MYIYTWKNVYSTLANETLRKGYSKRRKSCRKERKKLYLFSVCCHSSGDIAHFYIKNIGTYRFGYRLFSTRILKRPVQRLWCHLLTARCFYATTKVHIQAFLGFKRLTIGQKLPGFSWFQKANNRPKATWNMSEYETTTYIYLFFQ